jgi:hypothetical protein
MGCAAPTCLPLPGKADYTIHKASREPVMAAILPILIFVIAIIGLNLFEFGRAD